MSVDVQKIKEQVLQYSDQIERVRSEVRKVLVGQDAMLSRLLIALLTGGHVLLEGLPGLAKTTAIKGLASAIRCRFSDSAVEAWPCLRACRRLPFVPFISRLLKRCFQRTNSPIDKPSQNSMLDSGSLLHPPPTPRRWFNGFCTIKDQWRKSLHAPEAGSGGLN